MYECLYVDIKKKKNKFLFFVTNVPAWMHICDYGKEDVENKYKAIFL